MVRTKLKMMKTTTMNVVVVMLFLFLKVKIAQSQQPIVASIEAVNSAVIDGYGDGDSIVIAFNLPTDKGGGADSLTSKADVDNLFTFSQSLGAAYTGFWKNSSLFLVTVTDSTGAAPPQIAVMTVSLNGNVQNSTADSGGSTATSPALIGSFASAPAFSSVVASFAPGDSSYGVGDNITITFNMATNRASGSSVLTKTQTDALISASQNLGDDYESTWISTSVLVIEVLDATSATPPAVGVLTFSVIGSLRNLAGTSAASAATSGTALGSFADTAPAIVFANGPCPRGAFCPEGVVSPRLCRPGTFNANLRADDESDCLACRAGFYCNTAGLSAPTAPCQEGFYCPAGSVFANQTECPRGHYCPTGSASPIGCEDSTFQDKTGQIGCQECPPRFFCRNNASTPLPCPTGFVCSNATASPVPCAAGTFGNATMLQHQDQCRACPDGMWCGGDGFIGGLCSAGYLCGRGSASATQTDRRCQAGSYCLRGAIAPIPCPNATLRLTSGGASRSDCVACPPGKWCLRGDPVPRLCPRGYYCEEGVNPQPCDIGTYQPSEGMTSPSACLACPAGFWCWQLATVSYTSRPCEPGRYCPAAARTQQLCPAGTFAAAAGSDRLESCAACPEAESCGVNTTVPVACPPQYFCPESSSTPSPCPGSYYCPADVAVAFPCPPGYACPPLSQTPILCVEGEYCQALSAMPSLCPLGTHASGLSNRSSLTVACTPCAPGRFQSNSSEPACEPCNPGHYCIGSAVMPNPVDLETQGGALCPPGHFCPLATAQPFPCPVGRFVLDTGSQSEQACSPCVAGTFSSEPGQSGCLACPSSATSEEGAAACACIGSNRAFQASDKTCVCRPGHEFFDGGALLSEEDGDKDCQPKVYDRCASGQAYDSSGKCQGDNSVCMQQCGAQPTAAEDASGSGEDTAAVGGGEFIPTLGLCDCNQGELDEICDDDCLAAQPRLCGSENGIHALYPDGTTVLITSTPMPQCHTDCCEVVSISVSGGLGGTYQGVGADSGGGSRRRLLASGNDNIVISPAVICLQIGEGMLFDVSGGSGEYPIYLKDDLLNTNPDFDYGEFRRLASRAKSNSTSLGFFVFTFLESGVYSFASNAAPDKKMIAKVAREFETCPGTGRIAPLTRTGLVSLGVRKNDDILKTPDWTLIGVLVGMALGLFTAIIGGMSWVRARGWGSGGSQNARYKLEAKGERVDVFSFTSKGSTVSEVDLAGGIRDVSAVKLASGKLSRHTANGMPLHELRDADFDVDNFDFHSLYRKLDEHKRSVDAAFSKQQKDVKGFCDRLLSETNQLKALLALKMHAQLLDRGDRVQLLATLGKDAKTLPDVGGGVRDEADEEEDTSLQEALDDVELQTDAAERLVVGEVAARKEYDETRTRLNERMCESTADVVRSIAGMKEVEMEAILSRCRVALELIEAGDELLRQERRRRPHIRSHAPLLGDDIAADLEDLEMAAARDEDRIQAARDRTREELESFSQDIRSAEDAFASKKADLEEANDERGLQRAGREHKKVMVALLSRERTAIANEIERQKVLLEQSQKVREKAEKGFAEIDSKVKKQGERRRSVAEKQRQRQLNRQAKQARQARDDLARNTGLHTDLIGQIMEAIENRPIVNVTAASASGRTCSSSAGTAAAPNAAATAVSSDETSTAPTVEELKATAVLQVAAMERTTVNAASAIERRAEELRKRTDIDRAEAERRAATLKRREAVLAQALRDELAEQSRLVARMVETQRPELVAAMSREDDEHDQDVCRSENMMALEADHRRERAQLEERLWNELVAAREKLDQTSMSAFALQQETIRKSREEQLRRDSIALNDEERARVLEQYDQQLLNPSQARCGKPAGEQAQPGTQPTQASAKKVQGESAVTQMLQIHQQQRQELLKRQAQREKDVASQDALWKQHLNNEMAQKAAALDSLDEKEEQALRQRTEQEYAAVHEQEESARGELETQIQQKMAESTREAINGRDQALKEAGDDAESIRRVMATFDHEMDALSKAMNSEKTKQEATLQEKMRKRREQRRLAMDRRCAALTRKKEERRRPVDMLVEAAAVTSTVDTSEAQPSSQKAEAIKDAIESVIGRRHRAETQAIFQTQMEERAALLQRLILEEEEAEAARGSVMSSASGSSVAVLRAQAKRRFDERDRRELEQAFGRQRDEVRAIMLELCPQERFEDEIWTRGESDEDREVRLLRERAMADLGKKHATMLEEREKQHEAEIERLRSSGKHQQRDIDEMVERFKEEAGTYERSLESEKQRQTDRLVESLRKKQAARKALRDKRQMAEAEKRTQQLDATAINDKIEELQLLIRRMGEDAQREANKDAINEAESGGVSKVWWADHLVEGREWADVLPDGSDPIACDTIELSRSSFIVYRFGAAIIKGISREIDRRQGREPKPMTMTLLLAKALPPPTHMLASMSCAYAFAEQSRCLFVGRHLLDDIGTFVVVLIHALCHIRTGEWDRRHVNFAKELSLVFSILMTDLFQAKHARDSAASIGSVAVEAANDDVLNEAIDVQERASSHFAEHHLGRRLSKYKLYAYGSELRDYLNELDVAETQRDLLRERFAQRDVEGSVREPPEALVDGDKYNAEEVCDRLNSELLEVLERASVLQRVMATSDGVARDEASNELEHLVKLKNEIMISISKVTSRQ